MTSRRLPSYRMATPPRILVIAGSDSGGGAGIQADIKTISLLGGYAMTAVTAITAQNTQGVSSIHPVPAPMVAEQCRMVVDDIGVDAVKIGMLHDATLIDALAPILASFNVPIVLDPVMVASSGAHLLDPAALTALKALLSKATLLTPNIPEAEILSEQTIANRDDMLRASEIMAQQSGASVLLKGGHGQGEVIYDLLYENGEAIWFESARIDSRNTHGTGCTLSSAIATHLGAGMVLGQAVQNARDYVYQAILSAPNFGQGHGPLNHLHPLGL